MVFRDNRDALASFSPRRRQTEIFLKPSALTVPGFLAGLAACWRVLRNIVIGPPSNRRSRLRRISAVSPLATHCLHLLSGFSCGCPGVYRDTVGLWDLTVGLVGLVVNHHRYELLTGIAVASPVAYAPTVDLRHWLVSFIISFSIS